METYQSFKFKLQTISIEFFIGITIFLFIILVLTLIQTNKTRELVNFYEDFSLMKDLNTIDIILDIEGKPKDWNNSNFEIIGLRSSGKIEMKKVNYLKQIEYKKIKEILMIKNEFCIINFNIGNCSFEKAEKIFIKNKIAPIKDDNEVTLQEIKIAVWS